MYINTTAQLINGRVQLYTFIQANEPVELLDYLSRVYPGDSPDPQPAIVLEPAGAQPLNGFVRPRDGLLDLRITKDVQLPGGAGVIVSSYTPGLTTPAIDDNYRLQVRVDKIHCVYAGSFPHVRPWPITAPATIALEIVEPAVDQQVITARVQARFEAFASSPAGLDRLEFSIIDQSGRRVYGWNEHAAKWCAFGGNAGCLEPQPSWWEQLPNGSYRLLVVAYARDGGRAEQQRWFMKQDSKGHGGPQKPGQPGEVVQPPAVNGAPADETPLTELPDET